MLKFILLLAWPLFRRYLYNRSAEYTANFLNRRREQRLQPEVEEEQVDLEVLEMADLDPQHHHLSHFLLLDLLCQHLGYY